MSNSGSHSGDSSSVSSELRFLKSPEKARNVLPFTLSLSSAMNEASSANAGGRPMSDSSRVARVGTRHEGSRRSYWPLPRKWRYACMHLMKRYEPFLWGVKS